jgi:hypothetical protein
MLCKFLHHRSVAGLDDLRRSVRLDMKDTIVVSSVFQFPNPGDKTPKEHFPCSCPPFFTGSNSKIDKPIFIGQQYSSVNPKLRLKKLNTF